MLVILTHVVKFVPLAVVLVLKVLLKPIFTILAN